MIGDNVFRGGTFKDWDHRCVGATHRGAALREVDRRVGFRLVLAEETTDEASPVYDYPEPE